MAAETVASSLMQEFAKRTGLSPTTSAPTRYLWTDAFAVCNFLGLFVEGGDAEALALARRLVDQTHRILGQHRADDARTGWISGLDEEEGARHPTISGLRIGKRLPERATDEPEDPELEWERDGQYFHYLTKWVHALERMAQVTKDPIYRRWAFELARAAVAGFHAPGRGLYWKMSIDLSRPQLASMGHHDPLDGLVTLQQIQASGVEDAELDLGPQIRMMAELCAGRTWETDDLLGIGGLLCDAWRLTVLRYRGSAEHTELLGELLGAATRGLTAALSQGFLDRPALHRLAFREFGLSLGLRGAQRLARLVDTAPTVLPPNARANLGRAIRFAPVATAIERFWAEPAHRSSPSWKAHRDINEVMFATSLAPLGFLGPGG